MPASNELLAASKHWLHKSTANLLANAAGNGIERSALRIRLFLRYQNDILTVFDRTRICVPEWTIDTTHPDASTPLSELILRALQPGLQTGQLVGMQFLDFSFGSAVYTVENFHIEIAVLMVAGEVHPTWKLPDWLGSSWCTLKSPYISRLFKAQVGRRFKALNGTRVIETLSDRKTVRLEILRLLAVRLRVSDLAKGSVETCVAVVEPNDACKGLYALAGVMLSVVTPTSMDRIRKSPTVLEIVGRRDHRFRVIGWIDRRSGREEAALMDTQWSLSKAFDQDGSARTPIWPNSARFESQEAMVTTDDLPPVVDSWGIDSVVSRYTHG